MWKIVFILCIICGYTKCQQNILNYWVVEGPASMQFSINVASDSGLNSKISDSALQKAQFKIVQSSISNVFSINLTTGVLTPTGQIDREVICPQAKECTILMDISILSPPDYFEIIKISISVNDTNDNSPAFETNLFEIPIPENAAIGSTFTIIKAIDLDSPENGVKGYRILDAAIEISLKITINSDGTMQPVIELQTMLDREAKSSFQFRLEAFDSVELSNSNSDILSVKVNVIDVNDNPPVFTKDNYLLSVLENTPLQGTLIQVQAADPDIGDNGQLVYSFDSLTSSQYTSIFNINSDTGEIVLVNNLDYESIKTIELTVLAIEKNPTHMPAKCKVKISVEDVNDNEPVITVNPVSNTQDHIEIKENVKIGAFLAHISVSDKDSGNNAQVFCAIYTPNDQGVFELQQLSSNDYKLLTNASIDREAKSEYKVVFVCRDGGVPSLSADHQTKVIILDENDHVPVFTQDQVTLEVYENNPVGGEVWHLNVTDLDSGKNGEVVFQVLSGPQHYITLDPYTGNITARSSFDYEQAQFVTYEIIAYDQGDISHTATTTVSINILDTNDEPPQFMVPKYTFSVLENLKLGADVGQVAAYDPDSISNSKFQFELDYGSPDFNLFVIEPSSGAIFTRATFDREVKDSYIIKVKVVDTFLPSLFSITNVTITIDDQNDHKPEIEFPSENNNTFVITSNPSDYSKALTQIIATDADIGTNSVLEYSILSGNDVGAFLIDSSTGYIYVKDIQKLYKHDDYMLTLLVKDSGLPGLSSQTTLNILVEAQPEVLAVNTVIIITVGVLSGILVSSLVIAILLIKMRVPKKKKKYPESTVNGQGLPDHYTVQPVEDCRMGDDVSELSISVLSTSQHQANDQESTLRLSPNSLMQIIHSPQITTYDHPMFRTESRDKFSDGSNSDSGLGSHEEGMTTISSPVISMDVGYLEPNHHHIMIHSSPNRQQNSPNFQSSNSMYPLTAKRNLSFTNNNKPPPPPYHIARVLHNNNNTKERDDITNKAVSHQYPYGEQQQKEDIINKELSEKQHHQRSNSYNSSHHHHHNVSQDHSSAHLLKGRGHNENRQSPTVWENNPKGDPEQQKYKHLSYAESVHQNNDVAGHEIGLFNTNNIRYHNHSPKTVMSEVNESKNVKLEGKKYQQEDRENVNGNNLEQDNSVAEENNYSNRKKGNGKIAVVAPECTINNVNNIEDSDANTQFQILDNYTKNSPLKNLENQNVVYNNNNNNSSSNSNKIQIPLCLSNDNLNRYPRDESIVEPPSKNKNSENSVCNTSSLTTSNENNEQLSPLSTSQSKTDEETDSQQEFAGVKFVEFDSDHEENIV